MYGYYGAAIVWRGNKYLNAMRPFITLFQLIQMFVGVAICLGVLGADPIYYGLEINAVLGLLMYTSYAYLFGDFYIKNYKKNLSPINTLCAVTPPIVFAVTTYLVGWMDLNFVPVAVIAACALIVLAHRIIGSAESSMRLVSPVYYLAEQAKATGVEKDAPRSFAVFKGVDVSVYRRILDFSVFPCTTLLIDAIMTGDFKLRTMPYLWAFWSIHGYANGAYNVQKSVDAEVPARVGMDQAGDESVTTSASEKTNPKLSGSPVEEKLNDPVVIRRTVPVHG